MEAWPGFDRVVHEPVRFLILESLYTQEMNFSKLLHSLQKSMKNLSSGNLAGHLRYLEKAGYINSRRWFEGRKPSVRYAISELGKRKFEGYVSGTISRLKKSLRLVEKS
ncbi:MAG TPA: ArsR family transcriptional regulator [Candidatus Aenigmarchaeota archaeon]|nr:ArsR family transcriptional regulator [Candidatus Aenigmarchaeota archaeon]